MNTYNKNKNNKSSINNSLKKPFIITQTLHNPKIPSTKSIFLKINPVKMIQFESEKVYIEHCQNCSSHSWCTNHDESKYKSYFDTCKQKISEVCPELETLSNQIPIYFSTKFSTSESRPWEGRLSFPRIGSFEVYFKSKVIFSKLETGLWPQATLIASKIQETLHKPVLPQILKENQKIQRKRGKVRDSRSNDSKSTRRNQKRYKSTTPSKKFQKKHDFSYKAIKPHVDEDYDDSDFEKYPEPKKITKVYDLVLPCGSVSNKVTSK
jgi:hypothetical protein